MARGVGGAVGIILVPLGGLIAWGGLTGNLAAILAALFDPSQLTAPGATSVPTAATDTTSGSSVLSKMQSVTPAQLGISQAQYDADIKYLEANPNIKILAGGVGDSAAQQQAAFNNWVNNG